MKEMRGEEDIGTATSPESYDVFGHAGGHPGDNRQNGPAGPQRRQVNGVQFISAGQNAADASCPWTDALGAWITWL
jgi:hypothetical protein